jgi:hypothetical protein
MLDTFCKPYITHFTDHREYKIIKTDWKIDSISLKSYRFFKYGFILSVCLVSITGLFSVVFVIMDFENVFKNNSSKDDGKSFILHHISYNLITMVIYTSTTVVYSIAKSLLENEFNDDYYLPYFIALPFGQYDNADCFLNEHIIDEKSFGKSVLHCI